MESKIAWVEFAAMVLALSIGPGYAAARKVMKGRRPSDRTLQSQERSQARG